MRSHSLLISLSVVLCAAGGARSLDAQEPTFPRGFDEVMTLYTVGLGPFSRVVTTSSTEAQAYFNQGIQLMYAFTPLDAARSFREAEKMDPECAMCFWGEAWTWAPT